MPSNSPNTCRRRRNATTGREICDHWAGDMRPLDGGSVTSRPDPMARGTIRIPLRDDSGRLLLAYTAGSDPRSGRACADVT